MSQAEFWQIMTAIFGVLGIIQFIKVLGRSIKARPFRFAAVFNFALVLCAVAYPTVLWGGQMFGLWKVTPETGRPAVALLLAVVTGLGILVSPRRGR